MLQLVNKMPPRSGNYRGLARNGVRTITDISRCGTTAGYWWHYNHKEEICFACREARKKNQRDNHKYKSLALINPTNPTLDKRCGTSSGYQAHRKRNELSCESCHKAQLEYHRNRYKNNPSKILEQIKNWTINNPEKFKAQRVRYYAKNYEKVKQRNTDKERRRRAVKVSTNTELYTTQQVIDLYGTNCHICNYPIDMTASRLIGRGNWKLGLHIDHVISLSKNGPDTLANVRPSHALCNLSKGGK